MRVYNIVADNQNVLNASGDVDFVEITPADDKPVAILSFEVDQIGVADIGDAQEEFLRVSIVRGHATSGSGGTAPTPAPVNPNDTAAGATCEVHNTTIASAGTPITLWTGSVGVRTPGPIVFGDIFNVHGCPQAGQPQTTIVLRLLAAVNDDITLNWSLQFAELF